MWTHDKAACKAIGQGQGLTSLQVGYTPYSFQCFDTDGWTGRASDLLKAECWFGAW